MSGLSEVERGGVTLSVLYDLMGPQAPALRMPQEPLFPFYGQSFLDAKVQPSLVSPSSETFLEQPLVVGDLGHVSEITYDNYHTDNRLSFTSSGNETEDILTALSEFYLSRNAINSKKQQMLVPYFDRYQ